MFIAYIDEFGHQGPFISLNHPKHNTHPVFGYAGYVLPATNVRQLGGFFEFAKENLLSWEIKKANAHPRRWEKKGASLLTSKNIKLHGEEITRTLYRIYHQLSILDGELFFYGQEKPLGAVDKTHESPLDRENHCLFQTIKRLGAFAQSKNEELLVIMDATDAHNRERAVATLGKAIYSRSITDTNSVIEIPIQADSKMYGTVQLADWTCALLSRLTHYHFASPSEFSWSVDVANTVWKNLHYTNNSIIWTNSAQHDLKCSLKRLYQTTPFWQEKNTYEAKQQRTSEHNMEMQQRMLTAASPELRQKLETIRSGNLDLST